jgi:hypothetical protein
MAGRYKTALPVPSQFPLTAPYAPNFNAALTLAADCNSLFTTLREPLEPVATKLKLVACPTPFEMEPAPTALMLRSDYGDPFQLWLRKLCRAVFPKDPQ